MSSNEVICGDSLQIVPDLKNIHMLFADPPDNTGMKYDGFTDSISYDEYSEWLQDIVALGMSKAPVFWLSYYHKYQPIVFSCIDTEVLGWHQFIWRFTFGQHQETDCGSGYRPVLRLSEPGTLWNTNSIRVESTRQKCGDRRANPEGRVPDDVWEFPRVVGNARERRPWISNQHPEKLIERMVLMSTQPGELVVDMFAGSGTVHRVCKRLGRNSISIDISQNYVDRIKGENN